MNNSADEFFSQIKFLERDRPFYVNFASSVVLMKKLPLDLQEYLLKEAEKLEADFSAGEEYNSELAGHIKREYGFTQCIDKLEEWLTPVVAQHAVSNHLIPNVLNKNLPLKLHDLWVNFQQKHEFNPPHNHRGVISFVIWLKIPYDLEAENRIFSNTNDGPQTSRFNLLYLDALGNINQVNIPVDKDFEGVVCIFPSRMLHYVNPFYTSDDYRVSVAGNYALKVD